MVQCFDENKNERIEHIYSERVYNECGKKSDELNER